jgi:heme/copper-type cytochrome/quinol oxidase subunit 2
LDKGDARIQISMITAFLPAIFIILLFAVVYFVPKWNQRKKDNREELINISAIVISKRVNITSKYTASNTYHVRFLFPDQRKLELQVPPKKLVDFVEDQQGQLQFQGKRFLSWSPLNKASI